MARRRRPSTGGSIGIPGQRQRIDIAGSRYEIHRQPDRLVIHGAPGAEHVTVAGNERHVHIHTSARPEPERRIAQGAFFNFQELEAQLMESILHRVKREGLMFGLKKPEGGLKEERVTFDAKNPKYVSKWGGIATNITDLGKILTNESYLIHPLKLGEAMVSTKKAGTIRFLRDKMNSRRALELNEKYWPEAKNIRLQLVSETNAALNRLRQLVANGTINDSNRNFYLDEYWKAVREAEIRFQQRTKSLMSDYLAEWNKGK
jgi:hypothetical protein